MRDFNNGGDMNVGGDLVINDHSQNVGKLLINCTSEELLQERPFRQENLRLERNKKIKTAIPFLTVAVILFIASAAWAQINGRSDIVSFVLGIGSLVVCFAAIKGVSEPNSFEIQEKNSLREIKMILKSRRVE